MKSNWYKSFFILFIIGTMFKCINPYTPKLEKFKSILVVDALLTDENTSNYVILSRTIKTTEEEPEKVCGAHVIIKDDLGNNTTLSEMSDGVYKTDSLTFKGETGRSYTLYIKTVTGDEYESEPCLMTPVQDIDSIYFSEGGETINGEIKKGIKINIDSKGKSECKYYRWTYRECWKFSVPYPKLYNYINDSTIIDYLPLKKTCWRNNKSSEIIIKSSDEGVSNPILFIPSGESDRLLIQYWIEVRQFSLSSQEYEFWDHMKQISESGGDIFDKQPFQISGNIHSLNKPDEQVLGYFQVSGAKLKSRYITNKEITKLDIPVYEYPCDRIVVCPMDFYDPQAAGPLPTLDQIYEWYTNGGNRVFVEPLSESGSIKLVFVTPLCADCTLSGSLTKPDFWIDMN
jgi:hypothetical protein